MNNVKGIYLTERTNGTGIHKGFSGIVNRDEFTGNLKVSER